MKRKMLEKTEPELTDRTDDLILTAKLQDKTLEIDIFEKGELMARYFTEGEDYGIFTVREKGVYPVYKKGTWSKAQLNTYLAGGDSQCGSYYARERNGMIEERYAKLIFDYTKHNTRYVSDSYRSVLGAMEGIENRIRAKKKSIAYSNKVNRIDSIMDKVELVENTEEFQRWMKETVFPQKFFFAENKKYKKGKKLYCASCGRYFYRDAKHNERIQCKHCKAEGLVKTRTLKIEEKKNVIVLQRYEEETIERVFIVKSRAKLKDGKASHEFFVRETIRCFLGQGRYYYGQSYDDDAGELEQSWWTTKSGVMWPKKSLCYPGTLGDTTLTESVKEICSTGASLNLELDYNKVVFKGDSVAFVEYILKSRMYNLAADVLEWWSGNYSRKLNTRATKTEELLKLDKQRMNRLRDMNGNEYTLRALWLEMETGEKISQENLEFVTKNKISTSDLNGRDTELTANREINYLRRQMKINGWTAKQAIQFYGDYLDMAAERGMDVTDDIVRVNKRMLEFHNQYVEEKNRAADEKREKELNAKWKNIKKNYKENAAMYNFETEQFVFLVPKQASDIMQEGKLQHHCVGASDTYFKRMNNKESFIVFMRKKEDISAPFYTIEIKGDEIKQSYGAYDRKPEWDVVSKELTKWKKEIRRRMEEKKNARIAG